MYVRARSCQESQEETNEKWASERAGLGSYVRHVWVLDYIYIPMPAIDGEPRGPMRQYVPIILLLVLFHSLARSHEDPLPPATWGVGSTPRLS